MEEEGDKGEGRGEENNEKEGKEGREAKGGGERVGLGRGRVSVEEMEYRL